MPPQRGRNIPHTPVRSAFGKPRQHAVSGTEKPLQSADGPTALPAPHLKCIGQKLAKNFSLPEVPGRNCPKRSPAGPSPPTASPGPGQSGTPDRMPRREKDSTLFRRCTLWRSLFRTFPSAHAPLLYARDAYPTCTKPHRSTGTRPYKAFGSLSARQHPCARRPGQLFAASISPFVQRAKPAFPLRFPIPHCWRGCPPAAVTAGRQSYVSHRSDARRQAGFLVSCRQGRRTLALVSQHCPGSSSVMNRRPSSAASLA